MIGSNHGELVSGATFAPGKVGQGFSFDGVDDFVIVSDHPSLSITGDVTVELWARRTTFGGHASLVIKGAGRIGRKDAPSAFGLLFGGSGRSLLATGDILRAGFQRERDGTNIGFLGPEVTDTDFHHYAYVRFGNRHSLFMDGIVAAQETFGEFTRPGSTTGLPLVIGAFRSDEDLSGFRFYFGGVIDELSIYDQALSEAEIKRIYNAGSAGKRKP